MEPQGAECGWNANGTRTQKERVRARNDIFTVLILIYLENNIKIAGNYSYAYFRVKTEIFVSFVK